MKPVNKWIVLVAGFLQTRGTPNGMVALWREMLRRHCGSNTGIVLLSWRDDMEAMAEQIWRFRSPAGPKIVIAGYSWGGHSAIKLCQQLQLRDVLVDQLILSDAVYRPAWWIGRWRSLMPMATLWVPPAVRVTEVFRQVCSFPRGHRVRAENADLTAVIEHDPNSRIAHQYMDDLKAFHLAVDQACKAMDLEDFREPYKRDQTCIDS